MLPEMPPEMVEAQALGISFFAGEAEGGRIDAVLRDAWNGALQPVYNYMSDLPGLEAEPLPILPPRHFARPMISNRRFGKITRAASAGSSLRTTTSRATATGRRCSTE
jgi:hypothetical protein